MPTDPATVAVASPPRPGRLDALFRLTERGTTTRIEIIACITFSLAVFDLLVVIPGISSGAGIAGLRREVSLAARPAPDLSGAFRPTMLLVPP